jgi:hypothetical protein
MLAMLASAGQCTALRSLDLTRNHLSVSEMTSLAAGWGWQRTGLTML